jgi:hypothetical protein
VRVELWRGVAINWSGGVVLEFCGNELAGGFGSAVPPETSLCVGGMNLSVWRSIVVPDNPLIGCYLAGSILTREDDVTAGQSRAISKFAMPGIRVTPHHFSLSNEVYGLVVKALVLPLATVEKWVLAETAARQLDFSRGRRRSLTLPSECVAHNELVWDFRPVAVAPSRSCCEGEFSGVGLLLELGWAEIAQRRVHP